MGIYLWNIESGFENSRCKMSLLHPKIASRSRDLSFFISVGFGACPRVIAVSLEDSLTNGVDINIHHMRDSSTRGGTPPGAHNIVPLEVWSHVVIE